MTEFEVILGWNKFESEGGGRRIRIYMLHAILKFLER